MQNKQENSGARSRATFLVAILVAFGAGLLTGYLIGASGPAGSGDIPEEVFAVEVGGAPQLGPANAPVTIVIFTDFRCPHCRNAARMLEKLRTRHGNKLRVVFKHNPMSFHKDAFHAHEAAGAAHAQDRFWAFHDAVFAHQGPINRDILEAIATKVGLDMDRFRSDLDRHVFKKAVERDLEQGKSLGVTGTPTMFVNGRLVRGANKKLLEKVVRYEIRRTDELMEAGTPAEAIYRGVLDEGIKPVKKAPEPPPPPPKPAPRIEDPMAVYRVETGNSTVIGKPDAPVTLVMYIDYQCPFSQKAIASMASLLESRGDSIRLVFKNNPQPRHPGATLAAEAALAAGAQGKFMPMHEKLFANRGAQAREDLEAHAKAIGLDMAAFKESLDSHKFLPLVKQEQKLARQLGATSTPTYFINGRKLPGNQPLPSIEAAVKTALEEAQQLIENGIPAAELYEHIIEKGATQIQYKPPARGASVPQPDPNMPL